MTYSIFPPQVYFCSVRVLSVFDDNSSESGSGSVFSLGADQCCLVTARHVIDDSYRPKEKRKGKKIRELRAHVRIMREPHGNLSLIDYEKIEIDCSSILHDAEDNDLSVARFRSNFDIFRLQHGAIVAGEDFLKVYPGDHVCFIGYPSNSPTLLWMEDTPYREALYRQGVMAMPGWATTRIPNAVGKHYCVLDSFAKGGFSGSPVWLLPRARTAFSNEAEVPESAGGLLGVLSGHLHSSDDRRDGVHSGLSYFVRADRLTSLI